MVSEARAARRQWRPGLILSAVSLLGSLVLVEGFLRIVLFSGSVSIGELRKAGLYADPWLDDVYWKLDYLFSTPSQDGDSGRMDLHESLGWVPKASPGNPLGIVTAEPYDPDTLENPILFFGDSYVDGPEPIPNKVPQQLARLIRGRPILNYGVSGYGLDQIYLRFNMEASRFENPLVLVGIQDRDIDRSILSIRNGQKPLFALEDGELVVGNTPIRRVEEFVAENPPGVRSYLFRLASFQLRRFLPESWFDGLYGYDEAHARKLAINRRLIEQLKTDSEALGVELYVVLFYVKQDMLTENWRERFLKDALADSEIPYFDTKTYLERELSLRGWSLDRVWSDSHGHPNAAGNAIFAEGLASWLENSGRR